MMRGKDTGGVARHHRSASHSTVPLQYVDPLVEDLCGTTLADVEQEPSVSVSARHSAKQLDDTC